MLVFMVSFDDFKKLELKAATVRSAERVPGSEKLLKLSLDDGTPEGRVIVAGIGKAYESDPLVGRQIAIVANLEPRKLMGLESNGMLLAAHGESPDGAVGVGGPPVLLVLDRPVQPGSVIS